MTLSKKLSAIQSELNAPKGQFNSFGKYHYRNCEDILSALKPYLAKHNVTVTLSDDIIAVANRIYVKAVATLSDGENSLSVSAYAREADSKKGMDEAQITGSSSSYARKYALNGLFAIDDNKDADTLNNHAEYANQAPQRQPTPPPKKTLSDDRFNKAVEAVNNGQFDKVALLRDFDLSPAQRQIIQGL